MPEVRRCDGGGRIYPGRVESCSQGIGNAGLLQELHVANIYNGIACQTSYHSSSRPSKTAMQHLNLFEIVMARNATSPACTI